MLLVNKKGQIDKKWHFHLIIGKNTAFEVNIEQNDRIYMLK
jgi:hypothetical protein